MRVFVYGTLKRGFGNNYFLSNSEFISTGFTIEKFVMFNVGFPIVTYPTNKTDKFKGNITGELYEISDKDIIEIDDLEGHPHWYKRIKTKISDGKLAWIYVQQPSQIESFAEIILPRNGLLTFSRKLKLVE